MASGRTWLFTACAWLAIVVVAAALVVQHTPFGAALSMDSLFYLSVAQQMAVGNGIALPNYSLGDGDVAPLTTWPPLYAAILRFLIPRDVLFGIDAGHVVVGLNIAGLTCAMALFWVLGTRVSARWPAFLATLVLVLLPSMQVIYMYTWSETLFIPLLLAALLCFDRFLDLRSRHRWRWLALSVACLALGFHLRYAVLGFVVGLCASILLLDHENLRQRIRFIAGSALLFLALVAPLLLRNFWLARNLIGTRGDSDAQLTADLLRLGELLRSEVFHGFWPIPLVLGILVVAALVAVLRKGRSAGDAATGGLTLAASATLWALAYLAFLIVGRQTSLIDLDTRMIGPAMPFMMLAVLGLLAGLRQAIRPQLALGLAGLLVVSVVANGYQVHRQVTTSWQSTRTPGTLFGITYNSVSNPVLDPYRRLRELITLPANALILTDLARPAILHHFFATARVKQLPGTLSADELRKLDSVLAQPGLVVITSDQTASAFAAAAAGEIAFKRILDADGQPMTDVLLLELPIALTP